MGGISFGVAGMPSTLRMPSDAREREAQAPVAGPGGSLGDVLDRVRQLRGAVAEGAAAMQAREALGLPVPGATAAAPGVVWGGGAAVADATCGCVCCEPASVQPRTFAERATSDVFQAPEIDGPAQPAPPSGNAADDAAPAQDTVTALPAPDAPAEDAAQPAPETADAPDPVPDPAPDPAPTSAPSDGDPLPADAAPHDPTRREGEPNPVFYGDAPSDIPLPPGPGASGTAARPDADPGADVPPGEVDADAPTEAEAPAPEADAAPPTEPAPAPVRPLGELTPNQFTDGATLSPAEGQAACGPAAAVAFARFVGKDLSLDHVANVAREVGWDTSGMKGPGTQVQLLEKLGIPTHKEDPVNWDKVRETVQAGTPVIIDTPGHYWVAEGYNPADGRFNFAKSGAVYGDGGKTWYTPEEMTPHSGAPRSAIFLDR